MLFCAKTCFDRRYINTLLLQHTVLSCIWAGDHHHTLKRSFNLLLLILILFVRESKQFFAKQTNDFSARELFLKQTRFSFIVFLRLSEAITREQISCCIGKKVILTVSVTQKSPLFSFLVLYNHETFARLKLG